MYRLYIFLINYCNSSHFEGALISIPILFIYTSLILQELDAFAIKANNNTSHYNWAYKNLSSFVKHNSEMENQLITICKQSNFAKMWSALDMHVCNSILVLKWEKNSTYFCLVFDIYAQEFFNIFHFELSPEYPLSKWTFSIW